MVLTIMVTTHKGKQPDSLIEAVFDEKGGSLGRSPKNNLVLADQNNYISTKHADITFENGGFFYTDTSLNGTQIIQHRHHEPHKTITLKKTDKVQLQDKDELQVGDYKLVLSISGDQPDIPSDQPAPLDSSKKALSLTGFGFGSLENNARPPEKKTDNGTGSVHDSSKAPSALEPANDIDPFLLSPDEINNPIPTDESKQTPESPVDLRYDDFFSQDQPKNSPVAKPAAPRIPKPVNDASVEEKKPLWVDHPPPKIKPLKKNDDSRETESAPDLLNLFFKAAGITDAHAFTGQDKAALAQNLGLVFRELVNGLMMILRGRTELKSHLRLAMTTLKSSRNNPLKFFPTTEEVLVYILKNNHPGYIDASDAVREGFEDIKGHQLAINAGVQASLASILKRFDPKCISKKFEEGIVLNKKAKCWDEYQEIYPKVVEKALDDFFGEEFIHAYENQINRLRTDQNHT